MINGRKFLSRTPECYLWRSCAHDPEDSKSNSLVCMHKRQAIREPSLIIGVGHVSWLMMGLLALTRQKQLIKSSQVKSPSKACLFQDGLSWRNIRYVRSAKTVSEGIALSKKWDCKKQLTKKMLYGCLCTPSEVCPQWMLLSNESKGMVLLIAWNAIGWEIQANYIVKKAKGLILDEKIFILLGWPVIVWEGPTWKNFWKFNQPCVTC